MIGLIFKTVVGRWVTASLIALLLGGGAWKWHAFKEDLIHQGQQVCVQEINKQTVIDLQNALAAERATVTRLQELATAAAAMNQEAIARRDEAELNSMALKKQMEDQRNADPEYKEWSDAPLPTGVAERLRNQAAGGNPGALRDDSN